MMQHQYKHYLKHFLEEMDYHLAAQKQQQQQHCHQDQWYPC